jgi:queuine/archaeosine tRNA-ribosyltransferase
MFELIEDFENIRNGLIKSGNKNVQTPCYFMTSDFGGGGTNVSRLLVYSDMFKDSNLHLLLNYYYLDINSDLKTRFDTGLIKELQEYDDIIKFIQYIKKNYLTSLPKKGIKSFPYNPQIIWNPMTLLDSGSGNILRGKIRRNELIHNNFRQEYIDIIKNYFNFAISKKFDILIALDFAGKNALKDNEMNDKKYVSGVIEFSSNERNLELLKLTLDYMKQNETDIHVLAPVHGNSPDEYAGYIHKILTVEKSEGHKFSGFALGGLGNPNQVDRNIWEISEEVNGRVKAATYLVKLVSVIRKILKDNGDNRQIHVLGAAAPYNLIPLIAAGCDTFDCHSPWRRASDGNELSKQCIFDKKQLKIFKKEGKTVSFSKMLVPLLCYKSAKILNNQDKYLEYVNLNEYDYQCCCNVCNSITIEELKQLYCGNKEENYYAKILIYFHNILQYEYICKAMCELVNKKEKLSEFIEKIPDSKFKQDMIDSIFPKITKNLLDF